mgnify:CR=1 FL=1
MLVPRSINILQDLVTEITNDAVKNKFINENHVVKKLLYKPQKNSLRFCTKTQTEKLLKFLMSN